MALLSIQAQQDIRNDFMRQASDAHEEMSMTKDDLLAAITAADSDMEQQAAGHAAALPARAQTGLSQAGKDALYRLVAEKRWLRL